MNKFCLRFPDAIRMAREISLQPHLKPKWILNFTTCNSKCKMSWKKEEESDCFCCTQYYVGLIWLNFVANLGYLVSILYRCLFVIIAVGYINKFSCLSATLIFRSHEQIQTNSIFNGFSFFLIAPLPALFPYHSEYLRVLGSVFYILVL